MHNLPFDKPGRFWRGNLHTHSTRSDGERTPEDACRVYRELGYDFVAITDHFLPSYRFPITDTRALRENGFTTLPGAELHTGQTELGNLWHLLAVGLPPGFAPPPPDESGPEIAARALAAGAYVAVAHPAWYGLTEADVRSLGPVHAIEIYNATSLDHNDRPDSVYMLDLLLMRGQRYFACATDDTHFRASRPDVGMGWTWVKSETLTPDAILAALKAGHSYCSTGPQIFDLQVQPGKTVYVRCSPAARIFLTGARSEAADVYGNGLTEAEISLARLRDSPFCRVTVRDANGGRAWSNPIWL